MGSNTDIKRRLLCFGELARLENLLKKQVRDVSLNCRHMILKSKYIDIEKNISIISINCFSINFQVNIMSLSRKFCVYLRFTPLFTSWCEHELRKRQIKACFCKI